MKYLISILFCIIITNTVCAQLFEGNIHDAKTNSALAYVNVGVIGKAVGTVTDTEGHFKINLTADADSVKISMIGYKPKTILIFDLKKDVVRYQTIALEPAIVQLKDVKVLNRKYKEIILGNTTQSQSTTAGFTNNRLGHEIGVIIKLKKSPTLIKKFTVSIASDISDSVKLRLNFYNVKNGLPDETLTDRNIFVTFKKGEKQVSVDLLPYNIIAEDKFFVSLEWIQNTGGRGIMFSASIFSSFLSRETSQAAWEKIGLVGIGFNVLAEY